MGALSSRQNAGEEEVDSLPSHAIYRYPPKSGKPFKGREREGGRLEEAQCDCGRENSDLHTVTYWDFRGCQELPLVSCC
uniref:Uncharacterized protein n=1 Tax=Anolis carolinensis TaxID=28377 RepID=A0A803T4H0_ANOCA